MAFRHIRKLIVNTLSNETLYTVPTGREFVLMRKRVRNAGNGGTCSLKLGDGDSFEEISFTASDIVKHGQPSKMLLEAGTTVKTWLSGTAIGTTVELMGIELPAGSWVKVKKGSDRPNFTISGGNYPQINGTYYYVSEERYETEDHSYAVWLQDNQYWEISSLDEEGGPDVNYYYMNDSTGDIENVIGDHTWHDEVNPGGESVTLSINRNNNHDDSSSSSENSSSSESSNSSSTSSFPTTLTMVNEDGSPQSTYEWNETESAWVQNVDIMPERIRWNAEDSRWEIAAPDRTEYVMSGTGDVSEIIGTHTWEEFMIELPSTITIV